MNPSSLIGLVNNAALLLALGLLYDFLSLRPLFKKPVFQQILTGVVLGAIGIAIMLNPWNFGHGVVFDTRSVLLCIAGCFFGAIPTGLAVAMTAAFRLSAGGAGAWTGVAVIVTSGAIGLAWRHVRQRKSPSPSMGELYLMGIVVHLAMLAWMLSLPWTVAAGVLSDISLPVLLIYPLTTALLGMLMVNREKHRRSDDALRQSEEKFRHLFQHHAAAKLLIDPETGAIVEANAAAEQFYGWSAAELGRMRVQDINTLAPDQIKTEMEGGGPQKLDNVLS